MEKSPEKLKIMIVQGDEDNMTLYSDFLSRRGYHVIVRYTKGDDILTDVEWGVQKQIDNVSNLQFPDEQSTYRRTKQKTMLDYTSN